MHTQNTDNGRHDELVARRDELLARRKRILPPNWYTAVLIVLTLAAFGAWVWILAIASVGRVTITHLAEAAMLGAIAAVHGIGWLLMYYINKRHIEADEIRDIDREIDAEQAAEQEKALQEWMNENVWDVIAGMVKGGSSSNGQVIRPPFPRHTGVNH